MPGRNDGRLINIYLLQKVAEKSQRGHAPFYYATRFHVLSMPWRRGDMMPRRRHILRARTGYL